MSNVPKGDRGASDAEFLVAARQLKLMTVQKCSKLPKRLNHGINDPLIWQANEIKRLIVKANSIHPGTKQEAADRRRGFKLARAELFSMSSNVDDLKEMPERVSISYADMEEWTGKIHQLLNLVNGVMESDAKRYRNLP